MSEYKLTFKNVTDIIEQAIQERIEQAPNSAFLLNQNKAELLTAITGEFDGERERINEAVELWQNQISQPNEWLLGSRYIRIKDIILSGFKWAITSGLVDMILLGGAVGGIAMAGSLAITLHDIFKNSASLENIDFCIYMQAVYHSYKDKNFTIEEAFQWFPKGKPKSCNMKTQQWKCPFIQVDEICAIDKEKIEDSIDNLCKKNILKKIDGYTYKFEW